MLPDDAKEYSWKWVTGDELLSKRACEICVVALTCDGDNCYATIYDGENTNGDIVAVLRALGNGTCQVAIHHHIYCRRGLYIALEGDHCTGMLVQWLERPQGIGYP